MNGRLVVAGLGAVSAAVVLLLSAGAQAQSGMSRAEAAQLYTAAGFPIANGQPVNRCGAAAKPRVTFVDINGDKRPEALFVDEDARCYAPSGRYFAVLAKEGGSWRAVISGNGTVQALPSRTAGWLDMQVSDGGCSRTFRSDGRAYAAATDCTGAGTGTAPSAAAPAPAPSAASPAKASLQGADEAAAFKAAGFTKRGGVWRSGCDDPGGGAYVPGQVDKVEDLNGDGLPEAVITEGSIFCYGRSEWGYWVVSKLAGGGWKLVTNGTGIAEFLKTRGTGGWPDLSVGGPGFCFPVLRWNGKEYAPQRWEYEGKPCKPPR